jgi:hypothetical protein
LALGDLMQEFAAGKPVRIDVVIEQPQARIDELGADYAMIFGPASRGS